MKVFFVILALIGALHSTNVNAQTPFYYDGHILYYYQSPDDPADSVWICAPNALNWDGYIQPTGDLVIPSVFQSNGTKYVKGIFPYAFNGCSALHSVDISEGISKISMCAFQNCVGIEHFTIGSTIYSIHTYAFRNCTGLEYIRSRSNYFQRVDSPSVFENIPINIPIYIPCGSKSTYIEFWDYFSSDNFVEELETTYSVSLSVNNNYTWQGEVGIAEWGTCENPFVEIIATPYSGYHFDGWNDGNTENPRVVQLVSDTAFVASFGYGDLLTVTICSEDSIMGYTVPAGTFEYPYNTSLSIEAIPNEGYHFVKWKEDGYTSNPRTVYIWENNKTYTAVFNENTSVDENNGIPAFIFPNPTKDRITVEAKGIQHISIFNDFGQLVFENNVEGDSFEYDFGNQVEGIYLIQIETEKGVAARRISVTR